MVNVFDLEFEFPLEDLLFKLKATVEQQRVAEIYLVHSFEYITEDDLVEESQNCSLEDILIVFIKKNHQQRWVHKDSGKETALSKAIGLAIEKSSGYFE